jgi:3-oxoacyl-[acyl-carrier protein] reductase
MTDAGMPRSVLVTGGSRGLGAAVVRSFLDSGDRVATCSRTPTADTDAWSADPGLADRFHYESLDLVDRDATKAFVNAVAERFDGIDVLVNNAGVAREGVLALFSDDDIDTMIDLNVRATVHVTRLVVRKMLARHGSAIINISSIVGLSGYRGLSVYGATKASLDGFTRPLARELGAKNIRVNSVAPGFLRTEMTGTLAGGQLEQIARRTPLGRLGGPDDVTGVIQFLCSPAAAFITGQVLVVDGGITT